MRGEHGAPVVVVESIDDGSRSAFEGAAPRPGDRLVKIGNEDIAVRFAASIYVDRDADKAANDTVQSFIDEIGGPATVKLHVVRATRQVSPLLLSMSHTFEKFDPDSYWFGVYLLTVRLLETSMLVFFKKRTTKAMVATVASVISLTIAQKYKPWLRDSDDEVRSGVRARCLRLPHPFP